MAFCSRDKRVTTKLSRTTPSGVGPGTYNISGTGNGRVNYCPFSSSSERGFDTPAAYKAPGPGEYSLDTQIAPRSAPEVSSGFVSSTIRFKSQAKDTPGPGSYTSDPRTQWNKKVPKKREQKRGSVQWVRVTGAPSIPSSTQSYGYEENKEGDLVLQRAPIKGFSGRGADHVPVGNYEPYKPFGTSTRATDWSSTRSHRPMNKQVNKKKVMPGPGEYYPEQSKLGRTQPNRLTAAYKSGVKRTQKPVELTPGPGYYEKGSTLRVVEAGSDPYQFFGSKQNRKSMLTNDEILANPGPGEYELSTQFTTREDFIDPSDPNGGQKAAFSNNAARFDASTTKVPGPGEYNNQNNLAYDLSKKVFGRNTSFASTQKRFHKPEISVLHTPGPGAYVEKKLVVPIRSNSVFASDTTRFAGHNGVDKPGPTSYEIDKGIQNKVNQNYNNTGATVFKSKTKRDDATITTIIKAKVPGSGTYNADVAHKTLANKHVTNQNAIFKSDNVRFKSDSVRAKLPAPGAYDGDQTSTKLEKHSYNITVASGA